MVTIGVNSEKYHFLLWIFCIIRATIKIVLIWSAWCHKQFHMTQYWRQGFKRAVTLAETKLDCNGIVKKIKIRTNHFHFPNYSDFHFYFLHHVTKTVQIKMRATDWILMRNNHFHFLNHSDFHFYFFHHGKDGADKDASHRVDLDEVKPLLLSKSQWLSLLLSSS